MTGTGLVAAASSAVLTQIERLNQTVAAGLQTQANFTIKLARLAAGQAIEQQTQASAEQALDVIV